MILRVPENKLIYSKEPEDPVEYTNRLNNEYTRFAKAYDIAVKLLPFWKTWIQSMNATSNLIYMEHLLLCI